MTNIIHITKALLITSTLAITTVSFWQVSALPLALISFARAFPCSARASLISSTYHSKRSKKGRLALTKDSSGQLQTIKADDLKDKKDNLLRDVYVDGKLLIDESLTTIRERAGW